MSLPEARELAMACPIAPRAVRASRARALLRLLGASWVFLVASCVRFGGEDPRAARAEAVFECYVSAVEPYLGGAVDVAELVKDAVQGRASLPQALQLLGATQEDLVAVNAALEACRGAAKAPPVNPRTLAFREPPGDL